MTTYPSRRRTLPLSVLCLTLFAAIPLGCSGRPPTSTQPAQAQRNTASSGGNSLQAARDLLQGSPDPAAFRGAIRQLNLHISQDSSRRPRPMSEDQEKLLKSPDGFQLGADELSEATSLNFTLLDAQYLDLCFLFRDAVRSMGLSSPPPLERARAAFEWVIREVRLRERAGPAIPPHYILRRGWGTAAERAMIFLATLQQCGLTGCYVVVPQAAGQPGTRDWAVGVPIESSLYLFDPRLGLPLPGPDGRGIATLEQARGSAVLAQLSADATQKYDVTQADAKQCELHIVSPLSALAPRMKFLQTELAGSNPVTLAIDPQAQRKLIAQAAHGVPVKFWNPANDPGTPTRVLRSFFPPEEGGADTRMPISLSEIPGFAPGEESRSQIYRKNLFEIELIPWLFLPGPVRVLPYNSNPWGKLRDMYAEFFAHFPIPDIATRAKSAQDEEEADRQKHMSERLRRYFYQMLSGRGDRALHFSIERGSPRDHMLRGRLDEAASQLVDTNDQVRYLRAQAQSEPDIDRKLAEWCQVAKAAYATLYRAESLKSRNPAGEDAVKQARDAVSRVWSAGNMSADRLEIWLLALGMAAVTPMEADATYFLALCKQEQAERSRTPEAWQVAVDWWTTYLEHSPLTVPATSSALTMKAQALEALGMKNEARAAYDDTRGSLTPLERVARSYQIRRLKK